MAKQQHIGLKPGFLELRNEYGVLFLLSPKRIETTNALTLLKNALTRDFEFLNIMIMLRNPQKALPEHTEKEIRECVEIMNEEGRSRRIVAYVNVHDCARKTVKFMERLGFTTIFLTLDEANKSAEDCAREAILTILKAR